MKNLNETMLQLGDIVLTTAPEFLSKSIRGVTKSDISHAMIYVEAYSLIDSTGEGVHARNTQRTLWEDQCQVHVLRLKGELSDEQLQGIVNYARGLVGTQYSIFDAGRAVIGGRKNKSKKQYCSRLVAQAYACVGIALVKSPDFCTPEDLRKSPLLKEVPEATQTVSQQYIDAMASVIDTTELMRQATNNLLKAVRVKNKKIECINDIDDYLIHMPDDDAYIARAYKESGYLDIVDIEYDKHRWQYDFSLMIETKLPQVEKKLYCEMVLLDGEKGLQRYGVNRAGYDIYAKEYPLETFHLLHALYERIYELQVCRRRVAEAWLAQYEPKLLEQCKHQLMLTPHSEEWFRALAAWNPHQAQHSRQIISASGRLDICSVCGDEPARDYRLIGHDIPDGAISTLRLCNDCWRIRKAMYGESLTQVKL